MTYEFFCSQISFSRKRLYTVFLLIIFTSFFIQVFEMKCSLLTTLLSAAVRRTYTKRTALVTPFQSKRKLDLQVKYLRRCKPGQ